MLMTAERISPGHPPIPSFVVSSVLCALAALFTQFTQLNPLLPLFIRG